MVEVLDPDLEVLVLSSLTEESKEFIYGGKGTPRRSDYEAQLRLESRLLLAVSVTVMVVELLLRLQYQLLLLLEKR